MHVTLHDNVRKSERGKDRQRERYRERAWKEEEENLSGLIQNSALWQF